MVNKVHTGEAVPARRSADRMPVVRRGAAWLIAILIPLVLIEGVGRLLGLSHPVLFERTTYGYRVVPGQDISRFGHRIYFNSLGLRSEETSPLPASGRLRILCLGDSVTYGGASIDQAETFPYRLQELMAGVTSDVEVLNASAPGWAVENEIGWLRDNGMLGSRYVVLTVSTHDLFQPVASASVLGRHPSFPERQPMLALQEMAVRYLIPRLLPSDMWLDPGVARGQPWTEEMAQDARDDVLLMDQMVRAQGGELIVLFSTEAIDPELEDLATNARQRLFDALAQRDVTVLNYDQAILQQGRAALFRDTVHPTPAGNRVMAATVATYLKQMPIVVSQN